MDEKKRVLIVDDDEDVRASLALVFEEQGYETDTAANDSDALKKARHKFFNVALVDVRLLDGEGTALASALMGLHPDMATIVITGYATTETAIRALNDGVSAYVTKPLDMDEVLILVRRALEKQHLAIENRRLYEEAQKELAERRRVEETLRESEEEYRSLFEKMLDGFAYCKILVDERGRPVDFVYIEVNDAFEKLTGLKREDVVGKKVTEAIPGIREVHPELFDIYGKAALTGEESEFDIHFEPLNIWLSISVYSPMRGYFVAVFQNITERKIAEEALKASEERYRLVVDNAIEAIVVAQKGVIRFLNPATTEMTGYNEEEVLGRPFKELIHPDDREMVLQRHVKRLKGGQPPREYGFRIFRRDGEIRWVEINAARIVWDGEPAVMIFLRDVTEKKRADEERRVMEQQIQLAGRLVAVGELAAGVAHELNNPLAAVQAYAQLLKDRDDLDEGTRGDAATIYGEAQRASRITGNLLSFARSHRPEKSFVSLNEILQRSLELQAYRMRLNNIEVVLDLAPDLPRTMADAHQMQQVFVNLVTNAEHAMTEDGGGTLVLKTMRSGGMIDVTFTDDGPGIRQEDLRRIFDPFFTTKEVGKGTGLGLSICYGIVREHGGRISARNNRGRGATIVVQIPIVREGEAGDGPVGPGIAVGSAFPREPGDRLESTDRSTPPHPSGC